MSVTIDLPPELEGRLREQAAKLGVNASDFVVRAVEAQLHPSRSSLPRLSAEDARLLHELTLQIPPMMWERYHGLVQKRRDGSLSDEEHRELIDLSTRIEEENARRIERVVEIAKARGKTAAEVMDHFGLSGHVDV